MMEPVFGPFPLTDLSLWLPLVDLMPTPTTRGHCSLLFLGAFQLLPQLARRGNGGNGGEEGKDGRTELGNLRNGEGDVQAITLQAPRQAPTSQGPGCYIRMSPYPRSVAWSPRAGPVAAFIRQ